MLTFVRGNLFESPAKVLVNTVNTVGVMGKGIALTFKQTYPDMFRRYQSLCERNELEVGKLWLYKTDHKWILNFPTKRHWRNPSRLEYIEAGLAKFVETYADHGITSVAFPELGCGNGELAWETVRPLMARYLRRLPINVYIYLYDRDGSTTVEHRDVATMRDWLRREPRSLPFSEFWSDIKAAIRSGLRLSTAGDRPTEFTVDVVDYEREGLMIYLGTRTWFQHFRDTVRHVLNEATHKWRFTSDRSVYIPDESLLDLWQGVRFYGFCFKKMMPDGLDQFADFLLPLFRQLDYLRPVQLSDSQDASVTAMEYALQLYVNERSADPAERQLQLISA
ncbi:MAG TPA: macro domain-containing protein [Thermoanaerobaculia bacterium]|nr:macro domain-containing protein [Thermoanaerobaculia bacterium]